MLLTADVGGTKPPGGTIVLRVQHTASGGRGEARECRCALLQPRAKKGLVWPSPWWSQMWNQLNGSAVESNMVRNKIDLMEKSRDAVR